MDSGLADNIVPPAVWHSEGSDSCPALGRSDPRPRTPRAARPCRSGRERQRPYTPAVRRWVCIITLLFEFAGESYELSARPRMPVAMERLLVDDGSTDLPRAALWGLS